MKNIIELIINKHQETGVDVYAPATIAEISDFERKIGFALPKDFKEFYTISNGISCDEDMFSIIPLNHITSHPKDYGSNWFYFSEYMTFCDMWGLRFTSSGKYEIFNGSYPDVTMTSSLKEFLERFLSGNVFDPGGLYDWHDELKIKNA